MHRIIYILLFNFLFSETNVNGSVNGNWTVDNSPYIVTNNLIIQSDDSLIIDPGVEIKFDGNFRFDIFGYLESVGTETDSIIFTKNGDDYWMSLNFADSANDSSKIQYSIIFKNSNCTFSISNI